MNEIENDHTRPRVVSFSLKIPSRTPDNAGAEYVKRHYLALSSSFDVVSVADSSPDNTAAMMDRAAGFEPIIVERARWSKTIAGRLIQKLIRESVPFSLDAGFVTAIFRNRKIEKTVQMADVLEFQWVEYFLLAWVVKRYNRPATTVGIVHDVLTQRVARRLEKLNLFPRFFRGLVLRFCSVLERWLLSNVDELVVFSDKDENLVRSLAPKAKITVIQPSLELEDFGDKISGIRAVGVEDGVQTVLFVGNFSRPENVDAAAWLTAEIWPEVKRKFPSARLVLAGAEPPDTLRSAAERCAGVDVTGFVQDLGSIYRTADLVVVPLRLGAGLKFKTVVAGFWSLPIVTTTVGAEGVGPNSIFVAVANEAADFSNAISWALENPGDAAIIGNRAKNWMESHYGHEKFSRSVVGLYSSFVKPRND